MRLHKVFIVSKNDMVLAVFSSRLKAEKYLTKEKEIEAKSDNPQSIWMVSYGVE